VFILAEHLFLFCVICSIHFSFFSGTGFKYAVGTLAAATVATFAYAAYDKDFRRWLGNNVPYSEEYLKVVLQEQTTYLERLQAVYESLKSV
jgi:hypothetical protein